MSDALGGGWLAIAIMRSRSGSVRLPIMLSIAACTSELDPTRPPLSEPACARTIRSKTIAQPFMVMESTYGSMAAPSGNLPDETSESRACGIRYLVHRCRQGTQVQAGRGIVEQHVEVPGIHGPGQVGCRQVSEAVWGGRIRMEFLSECREHTGRIARIRQLPVHRRAGRQDRHEHSKMKKAAMV